MQKPLAEHEETNTFSANLFAVSESLRIFEAIASKLLTLDNKNKTHFILYCSR